MSAHSPTIAEMTHSPEVFSRSQRLQRQSIAVSIVERHCIAPPHLDIILANGAVPGILQHEEDKNSRNGDTRVQRGR